jgi:1-deoxy-D-xylulose-5-phosphate reductoisomerase
VLAQMGNPDMRIPIAHAMACPERFDSGAKPLDIFEVGRMDFQQPDLNRFPCLRLAYKAIHAGGTMPAILNAANEIAVEAFLSNQIKFTDIPVIIEQTMDTIPVAAADTLEIILENDRQARTCANKLITGLTEHIN